jgi:ATP-dependent exoDNAse (exonuclease V) beta subunit
MKYSENKSVVFNSENHTYLKNGKNLISVTSLVSKFKNVFDSEYWSAKIALRDNKSQEQVLKEWKEKSKKSCEIGTAIHKIFEDYVDKKYSIINDNLMFDFLQLENNYYNEFLEKKNIAIKFIKDFFLKERLTPLFTEYIVHNNFIAGQVDCICKNKQGEIFIIDFKTNDKIETNSYGKNLKGVLKEVPDSSFYHYSLQLSIYKQLLNKEVKGLYLVHITKEKYKLIECVDIFKEYNLTLKELIEYA